ncbi:hypothetical protein M0R89_12330 [Halorussus limi]|uniref:Preprotein translocase subunit TatA n=1 Tax=Halorussus limi TaxID=2938695 RepID=A0A8U0HR60_9EURY|nr:hypothetical protein [Halorussus limi]UPV73331.1 hypothetical protein M0R89_12330 [Halorussus limi]
MVPLFGPVPGGMEIAVILLVALLVFGLPIVLIGGGLVLYRETQSDGPASEEVESLRREVRHLREEIDELDDRQ